MTQYGVLDEERLRLVPDRDGQEVFATRESAVMIAQEMDFPDHVSVVEIEGGGR